MSVHHVSDTVTLHHGDCLDVLREMPDASVDAVVTDPPYGLVFMGRSWDDHVDGPTFQAWCEQWSRECLRVLKPGGHMLAFGGTRTWHRLACAVEDAGFEMRDSIAWLYGSGFPKSLDVSKAIDKAVGAEREVTGSRINESAPATPDAARWQGWGTALKPAFEPIVVARKPLAGTVAQNVLTHGTGAINVDGCRVGRSDGDRTDYGLNNGAAAGIGYHGLDGRTPYDGSAGRWPTNVVLDQHAAEELDEQSGASISRVGKPRGADSGEGWGMTATGAEYEDQGGASRFFPTFRYEPKAPTSERPTYYRPTCDCEDAWPTDITSPARATDATIERCNSNTSRSGSEPTADASPMDTMSITLTGTSSTTTLATSDSSPSLSTSASTRAVNSETECGGSPAESAESSSRSVPETGTSAARDGRSMVGAAPVILPGWSATSVCGECDAPTRRESHATVKPLDLMRWLVRLVTPPGGTVLEPFAGSGTTVEACVLEGFRCIAIEREADYLPLIVQRLQRRLDPVAYLAEKGEDMDTLFGEIA